MKPFGSAKLEVQSTLCSLPGPSLSTILMLRLELTTGPMKTSTSTIILFLETVFIFYKELFRYLLITVFCVWFLVFHIDTQFMNNFI